jgi:hypothetical protein
VQSPYYGAYFVSDFLNTDGRSLVALNSTTPSIGLYAVYSSSGKPLRVLAYNSKYFTSGTRLVTNITLEGLGSVGVSVKRFTATAATSRADQSAPPTIGSGGGFDVDCKPTGVQKRESVGVSGGKATVSVGASEAVIVYL